MDNALEKLIRAAQKGNIALVQQCLDSGVEVDAQGGWMNAPALQYAIHYRQTSVVKHLLESGASTTYINESGRTLLQQAAFFSTPAIVQLLQAFGVTFEHPDYEAAYTGSLENVSQTVIVVSDSVGATLMHYAAANGQSAVLARMYEAGANLNEIDRNGNTVLMYAASGGHIDTLSWLSKNGASLTEVNRYGNTALLLAAAYGQIDSVSWLLANGASLTEKNWFGRTAILVATFCGQTAMVSWLLENGASAAQKQPLGFSIFLASFTETNSNWIISWLAYGASGLVSLVESNMSICWFATLYKHWDLVQHLLLFHNDAISEEDKVFALQQLKAAGGSEDSLLTSLTDCDIKYLPKLDVFASTLTVTAKVMTKQQLLVIVALAKRYHNVTRLVIHDTHVEFNDNIGFFVCEANHQITTLRWVATTFDLAAIYVSIETCLKALPAIESLHIIRGQLDDEDVVELRQLSYFQQLKLLDLSENRLSAEGVKELLRLTAQTSIQQLNLASNYISADDEVMSCLNTKLDRIQLLRCDVSMNYFSRTTKTLFANPNTSLVSKSLQSAVFKEEFSRLLDSERCLISRNRWNIFLFREGRSQYGTDAYILIEGVRGYGQRFLTKYAFRPTGKNSFASETVVGKVEVIDYSPEQFFGSVSDNTYFVGYTADRLAVKRLIRFMLYDQKITLYYNTQANKKNTQMLGGRAHNGFTWILAKLVEASIIKRGEMPELISYKPLCPYQSKRVAAEQQGEGFSCAIS